MTEEKNILVVDDQRFVRMALIKELKEGNFSVDEAETGDEAIKKVEQKHFDLIFIDLIMPGKDGIDTCKELKKRCPNTQLVCFTGIFDRVLTQRGVDYIDADGPIRLLYKPFRERAFIDTACQLLLV